MTKKGSPIGHPILILTVLAEGGGIELYGRLNPDGAWQFSRKVDDWTPTLLDEPAISHASNLVDTWRGALKLLDRYPWHRLHPGEVHPEFAERIWQAYARRWKKTPDGIERYRDRWQSACKHLQRS